MSECGTRPARPPSTCPAGSAGIPLPGRSPGHPPVVERPAFSSTTRASSAVRYKRTDSALTGTVLVVIDFVRAPLSLSRRTTVISRPAAAISLRRNPRARRSGSRCHRELPAAAEERLPPAPRPAGLAGQVLRASGDRHRHIAQHRAPVVEHLRPRQRRRQSAGQAQVVDQHPGDDVPGVPDHIVAADLDPKTVRPIRSSLHLIGALLVTKIGPSQRRSSLKQCTFRVNNTRRHRTTRKIEVSVLHLPQCRRSFVFPGSLEVLVHIVIVVVHIGGHVSAGEARPTPVASCTSRSFRMRRVGTFIFERPRPPMNDFPHVGIRSIVLRGNVRPRSRV